MMNDSVREELQTKISGPAEKIGVPKPAMEPRSVSLPRIDIPRPTPPLKIVTSELAPSKTSPTLVEFQARNAVLPDWRLQLQNSVRQRMDICQSTEIKSASRINTQLATNGAAALKREPVEEPEPVLKTAHANPKVANALRRIENSRTTFLAEHPRAENERRTGSPRNHPFNVVTGTPPTNGGPAARPKLSDPPKPKLVPTFKIEKRTYDTNKLPRLETLTAPDDGVSSDGAAPGPVSSHVDAEIDLAIRVASPDVVENLSDADEIEDLAPVSLRFNAALFDMIIGAFGTFILISPAIFIGTEWFSVSGLFAFTAAWSFVMFLYLTFAVGMYGKTVGMRMFGLELIDADENDYPTFQQAAVNSAIYLLSMPLLGAGFIPMLFNEEQRAAHDLAAGTIIVNEL